MQKNEKEINNKINHLISQCHTHIFVRSKAQILKTAGTLKTFSTKIKSAQDMGTLTPETVKEISLEIMEVAEVAAELAGEIAEGVPAEEETRDALGEREKSPEQIEVAADETDEEKKIRMEKEKTAKDDDDDEKKELKEKVAKLERKGDLAEIAPKYASLFPQSMHEAKMNEILTSKEPIEILQAKLKEASEIIKNKTMVKIASLSDSPFGFSDDVDSEEVNIAKYV